MPEETSREQFDRMNVLISALTSRGWDLQAAQDYVHLFDISMHTELTDKEIERVEKMESEHGVGADFAIIKELGRPDSEAEASE